MKNQKKNIAKMILLTFVFSMILPTGAFAARTASDISGHWAQNTISKWLSNGLIGGYPDGTFQPDKAITRAEFIKLVNTAINANKRSSVNFYDVSANDWFYGELQLAMGAGYVAGFEDGSFRPSELVTRAQAAAFVAKAKSLGNVSSVAYGFNDSYAIPDWVKGAVGACAQVGYMSGYQDGTFQSGKALTRAEAVAMLDRVMNDTAVKTKDVTVLAPNTVISDKTIAGDLIIAAAVGNGDVTLKDVTVEGDMIINGGGSNSIHIVDSDIQGTVQVNKTSVRISFEGYTTIDTVEVNNAATLEAKNFTGYIDWVTVTSDVSSSQTVTIKMPLDDLTINSKGTINIQNTIDSITINQPAKITGSGKIDTLIANVSGITTTIKATTVEKASGVTTPTITSSSSSSSSSDSSGGSWSGDSGDNTIAVKTITMTPTTVSVAVDKTTTLTAAVTPTNATNKTVTWTTSDDKIATVDKNGVVTGVKEGTATIKATAGSKSATCTVTVTAKTNDTQSIALASGKLTINKGSDTAYEAGKSYDGVTIPASVTTLEIASTVADGNVTLKGVTVTGATTINGGGANSIHLSNCKLQGAVELNKKDVHLDLQSGTIVGGDILIKQAAALTSAANTIQQKINAAANLTIRSGTIPHIIVPDNVKSNVILTIDGTAKIESVEAKSAATITASANGTVGTVLAAANLTVDAPADKITVTEAGTISIQKKVGTVAIEGSQATVKVGAGGDVQTVTNSGSGNKLEVSSGGKITEANSTVAGGLEIEGSEVPVITAFTVSGKVTDSSTNLALPNATVTFKKGTEKAAETKTNASGEYSVELPQGTYTATVTLENYKEGLLSDIKVEDRNITGQNIALVKQVAVTGITLNKTELQLVIGGTETLIATVEPSDATEKKVTWSSGQTNIATVDDTTGEVTAVKVGIAKITAETVDGKKTAECIVTVKEAEVVDAEEPKITQDLTNQSVIVKQNEDVLLTIEAEISDEGKLSYAWYEADSAEGTGSVKDGETATTYKPDTKDLGSKYYYCIVTNTNNDATGKKTAEIKSAVAQVTVEPAITATVTVSADSGLEIERTGDSITVKGTFSGTLPQDDFEGVAEGDKLGYIIVGFKGLEDGKTYTIRQTNPALTAAYPEDFPEKVKIKGSYESKMLNGEEGLNVLVLADEGGSITIELYSGDVTKEQIGGATPLATVSITNHTTKATAKVDAEKPSITQNLTNQLVTVKQNEDVSLEIKAEVSDGGELSYAWYEADSAEGTGSVIDGETAKTYKPGTEELGNKYYYCIVTNTNNDVTGKTTAETKSVVAQVTVTKAAESTITATVTVPDGSGLTISSADDPITVEGTFSGIGLHDDFKDVTTDGKFGYITVGFTGLEEGKTYTIKQTNPALNEAYPGSFPENVKVQASFYTPAMLDGQEGLNVLVLADATDPTITIKLYSGDVTKDQIDGVTPLATVSITNHTKKASAEPSPASLSAPSMYSLRSIAAPSSTAPAADTKETATKDTTTKTAAASSESSAKTEESSKKTASSVKPKVVREVAVESVPTEAVLAGSKLYTVDDRGMVIDANFSTKGVQPWFEIDLNKKNTAYHAVRVRVKITSGNGEHIQLIAEETRGIFGWYDIMKSGWGPAEGFALTDETIKVYIAFDKPGKYTGTVQLVNVSKNKAETVIMDSEPFTITVK